MASRLKLPQNYRSAASRTPVPEDIHVEGGIALLAEAPADPGDPSTPMVVTVNGGARSRVTSTPGAGQYMVRTATSPQGVAHLGVLEFHASDEGLDGTCDYYRTGTVYTAEWFSYLLSFMAPITGLGSHAALDAFAPASTDPTALGRAGRMAFLTDFSAWYSDGTAWRQISGTSVITAADALYSAVFGATQDAIASHVGATAFGGTFAAAQDASWSPPGALTGSITADAILGALLDAAFTPGGLVGDFSAGVTLDDARDASYSAGGGVAVSDDFNRANGGLGSNWTTATGASAPSIAANAAKAGAGALAAAYWSANTFAADQYGQVRAVTATANGAGIGVRVRQSTSANTYYSLEHYAYDDGEGGGADYGRVYRCLAGTRVKLGADFVLSGNGYLRLEASGTTLTAKWKANAGDSWTTLGTRTDSNIATGAVGLAAYDTGATLDDWAGGDL